MHEFADRLAGPLVTARDERDEALRSRLADSAALAVRVAYSVVRNQADAEDVAQDAFVRACRRFDRLRDRDRFRAWLVRTTWRLALDWRRGRRRREAREDAVARLNPPAGDAEQDLIAHDRAARVWRAIDALPDRLRLALVLSAIEGHSTKEVSALLAVPEGTVKSRLFAARRALQERLR